MAIVVPQHAAVPGGLIGEEDRDDEEEDGEEEEGGGGTPAGACGTIPGFLTRPFATTHGGIMLSN
jgi:hypothetical protein